MSGEVSRPWGFLVRFTLAGDKDDSRDAEVMSSALRTDPRCFRVLAALDPTVIELREWSRIASDLGTERNRLTNRLREQLWRYYPAMLELEETCRRVVARSVENGPHAWQGRAHPRGNRSQAVET